MSEAMQIWDEFLKAWPPDRVRGMSLEEYTNLSKDDAFVYWLEARTEELGSIWGGSAFKFGIYRRKDTTPKLAEGGRSWGDEYAWLSKYGETKEAAFATVRSRLMSVIDAVTAGELEAIDRIDFSPAVKWKVAFLYQDRDNPEVLAIYQNKRRQVRYDEAFPETEVQPPPSRQHRALLEHYSWLGGVLDVSRAIWFDPKEQRPPEPPAEPRIDHPHNQILYGPPGTGKTYVTVGHALAIIDGREVGSDITDDEKQRFRERRFEAGKGGGTARGQIAMVTFHQNYAYEDFVEGIRPRLVRPDNAAGARTAETTSAAETAGDGAASAALEGSQASGGLDYELTPGIFRRICAAADAERERAEEEDREPDRFVLIIDEINRGNIPKIFGELITLIEPSRRLRARERAVGLGDQDALRRLGGEDETRVTLPYSGDDFGVPENLYVIGTMNTADRSIQQLDTALRRRFTFVEMMPEPNHKLIPENVDGVDCRRMLQAMNERIALLLDREHQIGHTYLLKVKSIDDLADRFRNRIFPLLQEYFYDDWRKIRAVLGGNAFVEQRKVGRGYAQGLNREFDLAADEDTIVHERLAPKDARWKNASEYRRIYDNEADRA